MALLLNAGDTVSRSYSYTQPSPLHPSQPQGTGERTGNLVRFYQEEMQDNFYGVDITVKNAEITLNGTVSVGSGHWVEIGYKFGGGTESTDAVVIPCEPETTYTITIEILDGNSSEVRLIAFGTADGNKTVNIGSSLSTVFSGDINRIFISLGAEGVVFNNLKFRVMFNKGSAQLPYEPYGVKIPISSAGQTTPVYLGEVKTTRKIRKLVLTGEESWSVFNTCYYITVDNYYRMYDIGSHLSACSHYPNVQLDTIPELHYGLGGIVDGKTYTRWNGNIVFNPSPMISSLNDWKTFLAQQYANGTPVTVWYVLAEPETAVVNEPLMKIGDYADEVSGITIPVNAGEDTLSVDTTVQPSEVSLSYTGWHNANVHEKSRNLFDKNSNTTNNNGYTRPGVEVPAGTYSIDNGTPHHVYYRIGYSGIARQTNPGMKTEGIVASDSLYVWRDADIREDGVMLNTGSTALPYEPYWT